MPPPLNESVAVITGASSGIGRATALALAREGAAVVVAARRAGPLDALVAEIEQAGGRALSVPTDVTVQQAVTDLAQRAVGHFGRIDIWINNAGVLMVGPFADSPEDDFRRVIDTNFHGEVHGARAVLPLFREQGHGTLINVGSLDSWAPHPHASAYTASKHAVRGFSAVLRQELALDKQRDVHVVTILPATIDTPLFQHAANYTGRQLKAPPPVYPPEEVVSVIFEAIREPKPEVYAGSAARGGSLLTRLLPGTTERVAAEMVHAQEDADTPATPSSGNLFVPMDDGWEVSGGWQGAPRSAARRLAIAGSVLAVVPAVRVLVNRLRERAR